MPHENNQERKYQKELTAAIALAKQAGVEVMKIYNSDFTVTDKDDDSPVTQADLTSNKIITDGLKDFGYGIIAEESGDNNVQSDRYWLIDPLDATKDFIQKKDEFSIMIGLLENGEPVLGVVYGPALGVLYYAVKGEGAFVEKDGQVQKISVSKQTDLSEFTIYRSRNHFFEYDKRVAKKLNVKKITKAGSIGLKLGFVAEGKAELIFYASHRFSVWDVCAGQAILEEAGGEVFDLLGRRIIYDLAEQKTVHEGLVGTNGTNKGRILEVLDNSS